MLRTRDSKWVGAPKRDMHVPPRLFRSVSKQARDNYVPTRLWFRSMARLCCDTSVTEIYPRCTQPHPGRLDQAGLCQNAYACSFQNLPIGLVTKKSKPHTMPWPCGPFTVTLREGWEALIEVENVGSLSR
jgi:hypothetical protein